MSNQKKRVYPSWRYHKELGEKLIQNEAQHEHLEKQGWHESPAAFQEVKSIDPVSELDKELEALKGEEPPVIDDPKDEAPEEFSVEEIREILIERGHTKKELKNKSHEELKAMLAE